ncbi:hypothetical protein BDW59DRAFT_138020 [Aspergillus cavernicola]|uniref:Stress-associated endoplasmic reticulum protein n=1 Tax=Aspergillus cavernicola TaxID=176166 RepID=A0ABR4J3C1_9EURO
MAQTPQQRRANDKFAKQEAAKRGKSKATTTKQGSKPSLSLGWVGTSISTKQLGWYTWLNLP